MTKTHLFIIILLQEIPATLLEKSHWIVGNSFEDFGPIQRLDTLRIANVRRVEPILDLIQWRHRNRSNRSDLLGIVLVNADHVKILQREGNTLKVNKLNLIQRYNKRWPFGNIDWKILWKLNTVKNLPMAEEVGCNKQVDRCGTPWNPKSLKGVSNSKSRAMFPTE